MKSIPLPIEQDWVALEESKTFVVFSFGERPKHMVLRYNLCCCFLGRKTQKNCRNK
jgi:hypothetical protein